MFDSDYVGRVGLYEVHVPQALHLAVLQEGTVVKLPQGYVECQCGFAYRAGSKSCRSCGRVLADDAQDGTKPSPPTTLPRIVKETPSRARKERVARSRTPNKTELSYRNKYLDQTAMYEGVTLHLKNGHRYTPDWVIFNAGGLGYAMECVEVKGSYRFGSHGRAQLAFSQAKLDFPHIRFKWAELGKNGKWKIT